MTDVTPANQAGDPEGAHEETPSPLRDPRVHEVVESMWIEQQAVFAERRRRGAPKFGEDSDPEKFADMAYPLQRDARDLVYLLARATGARRVVEFATSLGVSTMYLAAAVRDNGGGTVIGSEIVPTKAAAARKNLAACGLEEYADIRLGDARATLRDVGGPIDFVLIDGWPSDEPPSLALEVLRVLVPQLRSGAMVLNDNGERDFLAYVRDPASGFTSQHLFFESRHVELALYDPPS